MKTQQEIVDKIKQWEKQDFFGVKTSDLVVFLDYEHAKEFLKPEVKPEEWEPEKLDEETIKAAMLEYMPFAWEKANGERGLSAARSMSHYSAWVWLLGDDEHFGDLENYTHYGKGNLVQICERYGWDSKIWDDGVRTN